VSTEQSLIDPPPVDPATPTFREFLETAGPFKTQLVLVDNVVIRNSRYELKMPEVMLYCPSAQCDKDMSFDPLDEEITLGGSDAVNRIAFVRYKCRHCKVTLKTYALRVKSSGGKPATVHAMKFGEDPPSIGPTPRSLKDLLGDQWELFLQGRRAEIAGLGIGAFAYYRRVVEHVWQRVLLRLQSVAGLEGSAERTQALNAAKEEKWFTRSMELAKEFVPPSLFVNGHNPFQRLYDACGDAIHEYTDAECLARARVIRLVLGRFAERAKAVLAEDAELSAAVGALANLGSKDTNG
jgi:hypothetical protein